ncbi:RNA pseudouridine synthase 5 isoform X3 [Coffea arabica]|uniref:RNA pseudouridine synthase 5 isoform X3 n=1 Tax=Coffea arabica TaxID=13443 RepID=A0ABM4WEY4_COFAR
MSSSGKPLPSTTLPRLPIMTFGEPWPDLNDGLTYRDLIPPPHAGLTVIEYYSKKYKNSAPVQGWLQRIKNKQIKVDGAVITDPNTILRAGSELVYHRLPWKEPHAPYLLEVLFEDNDLIALNKPSGLQVLPGGLFQQRTVLSQLEWRTNKGTSSCKQPHAVPVHRLGRGTSGVLLCAKTKLAKSCLAAYFADGTSAVGNESCNNARFNSTRKISKFYRALVSGIIHQDQVVIDQPIGLVKYPGVAKGLYVASASGKPALSKVSILERNVKNSSTLVQVEIQSGRPHQIRIHLSFIGHPLLGDPLYVAGGQPSCFDPEFIDEGFAQDGGYQRPENPVPGDCGYHLHAHQLFLAHPTTHEPIKIVAPLPSILATEEECRG